MFQTRFLFFTATISTVRRFPLVAIFSRKGLLAIAAVVDVASQKDGQSIAAKTLAARHGLPPRYLEAVLRALVHAGILKGIRGPHGGYLLARERHRVTANDILRAAGTVDATEEELNSALVVKVVLPVLSAVEQECGQALSRISLDDMVNHASLNGHERIANEPLLARGEPPVEVEVWPPASAQRGKS